MKDSKKDYLKEIQVHEQQEWDFECVHQKTGERRWFHSVAMGSEVNGKKKYILQQFKYREYAEDFSQKIKKRFLHLTHFLPDIIQ